MPESVTIVQYPRGYVANLRYADSTKDKNISATNHTSIYILIEREFHAQNNH